MYTIDKQYTASQIIKKSEFICNIFPIKNLEDAQNILQNIRKQHHDATHNCYAMIYGESGEYARSSDDGEPSQTAGVVILDVLQKNELTNVLAVVTRYFGGIKLGAGGLVRAYSSSTSGAVKIAKIIPIIKTTHINIKFDYTYTNEILKLFKNYKEIESKYETKVSITYEIPISDKDFLQEKIISLTKNQTTITFFD